MMKDENKTEPRKPYTAPKLITYGSVAELTKGSTGSRKDVNSKGGMSV